MLGMVGKAMECAAPCDSTPLLSGFPPEPGVASPCEVCTETSPRLQDVRVSTACVSGGCLPCIHLQGLKYLCERQFQTSHLPVAGKQNWAFVGSNLSACNARTGNQHHLVCHCHPSFHCKKTQEEIKAGAKFIFEANNKILLCIRQDRISGGKKLKLSNG